MANRKHFYVKSSGQNYSSTFQSYVMNCIENDTSNSYSIVACIHCHSNAFTESLPSNNKGILIDTQTGRRDL
jgi:hypothetical protein